MGQLIHVCHFRILLVGSAAFMQIVPACLDNPHPWQQHESEHFKGDAAYGRGSDRKLRRQSQLRHDIVYIEKH